MLLRGLLSFLAGVNSWYEFNIKTAIKPGLMVLHNHDKLHAENEFSMFSLVPLIKTLSSLPEITNYGVKNVKQRWPYIKSTKC